MRHPSEEQRSVVRESAEFPVGFLELGGSLSKLCNEIVYAFIMVNVVADHYRNPMYFSAWSGSRADFNSFELSGTVDCKVSCRVNIDFAFNGVKVCSDTTG